MAMMAFHNKGRSGIDQWLQCVIFGMENESIIIH